MTRPAPLRFPRSPYHMPRRRQREFASLLTAVERIGEIITGLAENMGPVIENAHQIVMAWAEAAAYARSPDAVFDRLERQAKARVHAVIEDEYRKAQARCFWSAASKRAGGDEC